MRDQNWLPLELPGEGKRQLVLQAQGDGRYAFGSRPMQTSREMLNFGMVLRRFTIGLAVLGAVWGAYGHLYFMLGSLLILILAATTYLPWLATHRRFVSDGCVVLDVAAGELAVKGHGTVAERLPLALATIEVEPATPGATTDAGGWWVVIHAPASEEADEPLRVTTRVYGPGHRGDIEMAAMAIRGVIQQGGANSE